MFYRANQFHEIPSGHRDIFTGAGRRTDRWQLRLDGYTDPQIDLYIYSAHLRAGSSSSQQADRLFGAQEILEDITSLPAGSRVIVSGDMNFGSNGEDAYEAFTTSGLDDPLGVGSWSGASNAIKHSQSPRASGLGGLVGGGMDDRFDFQLTSPGLLDGGGFAVIEGTYRHVSNDGNHYDTSINDGTNTYWPDDVAGSNALADAMYSASDHIPVACDYQIPARLAGAILPTWGPIIVGGSVEIFGVLANDAPVFVSQGADECFFAAAGSGAFSGTDSGVLYALAAAHEVFLIASAETPGTHVGTISVVTIAEDVPDALELTATGTALAHANATFDEFSDVTTTSLAIPVEPDQGVVPFEVTIFNRGFDDLQALLDCDAIDGMEAPVELLSPLETGVGEDPAVVQLGVDTQGFVGGEVLNMMITIHVSDEDLPGEANGELTLELEIRVSGDASCSGDVTGDQNVTIADLLAVIDAWGTCQGCAADINDDGLVGIVDLLLVIEFWGPCP
jgi:hypothetical protein